MMDNDEILRHVLRILNIDDTLKQHFKVGFTALCMIRALIQVHINHVKSNYPDTEEQVRYSTGEHVLHIATC